MSYGNVQGALNQYRKVGVHAAIADASPHRLIQMLMEGALDKIQVAKGHMERGEVAAKGKHISWAISIIDGLRTSLDMKAGGKLAENLDDLYDYMSRRLLDANLHNEPAALDEVTHLLLEIKQGWDAIPEPLRHRKPASAAQAGGV